MWVDCPNCRGTGRGGKCPLCRGSGRVTEDDAIDWFSDREAEDVAAWEMQQDAEVRRWLP